jgi:hypothetical protein
MVLPRELREQEEEKYNKEKEYPSMPKDSKEDYSKIRKESKEDEEEIA